MFLNKKQHSGDSLARFNNGWFRVDRRVFNEDIAQMGNNYLIVWLKLLSWANVTESNAAFNGERIILKPGQLITGLSELGGQFISKSSVNDILKYLEKSERIVNEVRTRGRLITICNWYEYQTDHKKPERSPNETRKRPENGPHLIEQYNNITNNSDFLKIENSNSKPALTEEEIKIHAAQNERFLELRKIIGTISDLEMSNDCATKYGISLTHIECLISYKQLTN